jgi:hypothetical protein
MRGQANWYDDVKGATPLHWYIGYVVGVMGWLPSALIVVVAAGAWWSRDRMLIACGVIAGVAAAMFCLYQRTQLHAQPEYIAMLLTLAIAVVRTSRLPDRIEQAASRRIVATIASLAAAALMIYTAISPPEMRLRGFAPFMAEFDKLAVPAIFEQPPDVRTIALEIYPVAFWGVGDAWCRGSVDIFGGHHSNLLDRSFGNTTCMLNVENPSVDISRFDRAVFPRSISVPLPEVFSKIETNYPNVAKRFSGCHSLGTVREDNPRFEVWTCGLR